MTKITGAFVYLILVDGVVRYVGKGRGSRHKDHLNVACKLIRARRQGKKPRASLFYNRLAKAVSQGCTVTEQIVASSLTDEAAFDLEVDTIALFPDQLWNTTSGGNGLSSEDARQLWLRPGHREKVVAKLGSPEYRQTNSEAVTAKWQEPEYRTTLQKRGRDKWLRPDFKARMSQQSSDNWKDPDYRERTRAGIKRAMAKPATRELLRTLRQEMWADLGYRAKWYEARWGSR